MVAWFLLGARGQTRRGLWYIPAPTETPMVRGIGSILKMKVTRSWLGDNLEITFKDTLV